MIITVVDPYPVYSINSYQAKKLEHDIATGVLNITKSDDEIITIPDSYLVMITTRDRQPGGNV